VRRAEICIFGFFCHWTFSATCNRVGGVSYRLYILFHVPRSEGYYLCSRIFWGGDRVFLGLGSLVHGMWDVGCGECFIRLMVLAGRYVMHVRWEDGRMRNGVIYRRKP
jgi:hypothetical protein